MIAAHIRPPCVSDNAGRADSRASASGDLFKSVAHILFVVSCAHRSQHDSILRAAEACEDGDYTALSGALHNIKMQAINVKNLIALTEGQSQEGIWK